MSINTVYDSIPTLMGIAALYGTGRVMRIVKEKYNNDYERAMGDVVRKVQKVFDYPEQWIMRLVEKHSRMP